MTDRSSDTPLRDGALTSPAAYRRLVASERVAARPLRKLSSIEAAMAYSHAILAGNTQATFLLSVKGEVSLASCAESVAHIASRHEILSCRIHDEGDDLWFCDGHPLDLPLSEDMLQNGASIETALEHETAHVLNPRESLWRLKLLRDHEGGTTHLALTQHHAIADAHTAQSFFIELLEQLDGAPVRRPFETLTPGADAAAAAPAARANARSSSKPLPFLRSAELADRSTGVWIADLTDAESVKLKSLARREGASVNSTLVGLFVAAFCEAATRPSIDVFTAVSLRDRLIAGRHIDDLGCFIRVPAISIAADENALSIAVRYGDALQQAIADSSPTPRPHSHLRAAAEATRVATAFAGIGVTNLGIIDALNKASRREILAYRPAVNRVGGNLGLTLHIVRLCDRFHLTMTFPRPLMSDEIVDRTVVLMKRRLSEL